MFGKSVAHKLENFQQEATKLDELERQRTQLQETLAPAELKLKQARQQRQEAKTAFTLARESAGQFVRVSDTDAARIKKLEQAVEAAEPRVAEALKTFEARRDKVTTMRKEEKAIREAPAPEVSIKDIQQHIQSATKLAGEVARFDKLLAGIKLPTLEESGLADARDYRRNVLADLAQGKAKESDLEKADANLAKLEEYYRKAKRHHQKQRDTIKALQARRDAVEVQRRQADESTTELVALCILTRAKLAQAEYIKQA